MARKFILSILFLLTFICHGFSQSIINDKATTAIIREGIDKMYNFEFEEAEKKFIQVKKKYPDHPAYYLLIANNDYWKSMSTNSYKENSEEYYKKLKKTLEQSEKYYSENKKTPEGIFFLLGSHSALSSYYNSQEEYVKAMNEARKAYSYVKEGFVLKEKFHEFYFTTGLYNYYTVRFPETRPFVKPFMIFFSGGNVEEGIKDLKFSSQHGTFTKTESLNYLVNIFLKYENQPGNALNYSHQLIEKYPKNLFFNTRHTEALIAYGKYEDAENRSKELKASGNKTFEMAGNLFLGLIAEKHHHKIDLAKNYYLKAIALHKEVSNPSTDYLSFAYAGMGRIYASIGDHQKGAEYYKKALKIAQYSHIKKEAEEYLSKHD